MVKKFIMCMLFSFMMIIITTNVMASDLLAETSVDSDLVTVNVCIKDVSDVCTGGFNLIYDNSALEVTEAKAGELLSGTMVVINPEYAENAIRVTWAGLDEISSEGSLLVATFKTLKEIDKTEFAFEKVKFTDFNGEVIDIDNIMNAEVKFENTNKNVGSSGSSNRKPSSVITTNESKPQTGAETHTDEKTEWINPFMDIKETDWYYKNIEFVSTNGYMKGISENEFAPDNELTRSMFVTILYRMENEPEQATAEKKFEDVESDSWYEKAVLWANEKNIVYGVSDTSFDPFGKITREQLVTMLYRYAMYKNINVYYNENIINEFDDVDAISEYAQVAVEWAVTNSIINGKTEKTINPSDTATRAETAAMLMRYLSK